MSPLRNALAFTAAAAMTAAAWLAVHGPGRPGAGPSGPHPASSRAPAPRPAGRRPEAAPAWDPVVAEFDRKARAGASRAELAAYVDRIAAQDPRGNAAYEEFAERIAEESLPDALAWLRAMPPSDGRNYALGTMAAEWARSEPGPAMAWAMGLSSAEDRAGAMERVFNRWCNGVEPDGAVLWLEQHEADPASDRLIADLIGDSTVLQAYPDVSARWAAAISNPELRARTLQTVLAQWGRQDSQAAARFAQSLRNRP